MELPRLHLLTLDELDVLKQMIQHFEAIEAENDFENEDQNEAFVALKAEVKRCHKAAVHGIPADDIPLGQVTLYDEDSQHERDDW